MKEIESWKDGQWIPNSKIGTNLWDAHYFFGWSVFDAFRTYNHNFHMLDCHIARFYKSARLSGIDIKQSERELIDLINITKNHNASFFPSDEEYRFMIFASPGYFKIYDDMGDPGVSLTINLTTTSRYAKHVAPYLDTGVTSLISSQRQIPSRFLNPKIKSCSRLHYGLADLEAAQYGKGVTPILLDEHGYISESSGSNISFVKGNNLCVPISSKLEGCTERSIMSITDMNVITDDWDVYDLIDSDGIIFTSTFSGITSSWNLIYRNKKYKLNKTDKINKLIDSFSEHVEVDVNKQWKDWMANIKKET